MRATRVICSVFIAFAATVTQAQVHAAGCKHTWLFEDHALSVAPQKDTEFPSRKRLCFGDLDSSALIFIIDIEENIFNPADNYCENPPMIIDNKRLRPVGTKVECLYGKVSPMRGQLYIRTHVRNKLIRKADRHTIVCII